MKSFIPTVFLGLASLVAADTTPTDTSIPASTDASSFLSEVYEGEATPTWATGKYATTLASALYSAQTSFAMRSDYRDIVEAIWSAAEEDGGSSVVESLSASYWNWGAVTTNPWFRDNVPGALQTAVAQYDDAWESVYTSVEAKATATKNAAAPRCTGMAVAGVAALGVAAVAGAIVQQVTGDDIARFIEYTCSKIFPLSLGGKKLTTSLSNIQNGIRGLLSGLVFKLNFQLSRRDAMRIDTLLDALVKEGKLIKGWWRKRDRVGFHLFRTIGNVWFTRHLTHRCMSWDVIISKFLAVSLQAATASQAGDMTRSLHYKGLEYMRWEHIQLVQIVPRPDEQ